MKVSSLSFTNFKTFQEEEVFTNLKNINYLIGPNGVGKTNVWLGLEAIKNLFNGLKTLARNNFFDKNDKTICLSITFKLTETEREQILNMINDAANIPDIFMQHIKYSVCCSVKEKISEVIFIDDIQGILLEHVTLTATDNSVVGKLSELNNFVKSTQSNLQQIATNAQSIYALLQKFSPQIGKLLHQTLGSIQYIPSQRMSSSGVSLSETQEISLDGNSLANELATILQSDRDKYARYEHNVRQVTQYIKDVRTPPKGNQLTIEIGEDGLDKTIEHSDLSSGFHQSLILPRIISDLESKIVFLEEPELHLHPKISKKVINYY